MTDARAKALEAARLAANERRGIPAAITAYLATMAEAGYVLVPREPTIDMEVAGTEAWLVIAAMEDRAVAIYRAMIAEATRDKEK